MGATLFSFSDKMEDTEKLNNVPKVTQPACGTESGTLALCHWRIFLRSFGMVDFLAPAGFAALVAAWHRSSVHADSVAPDKPCVSPVVLGL